MSPHNPSHRPPLSHLLLFTTLSILSLTTNCQKIAEFQEDRPSQRYAVPNSAPGLEIALDYDQPFDLVIKSYNGDPNGSGFCTAYPSTLEAKVEWTGPFDNEEKHSYDNIGYYKGLFIILDSVSLNLLVTSTIDDKKSYVTVESKFKNLEDADNQILEPYMHVDQQGGYLYIFNNKELYSYALEPLVDAIQAKKKPPQPSYVSDTFKQFEDIRSVQQWRKLIYIVADNDVFVYRPTGTGDLDLLVTMDSKFFKNTDNTAQDGEIAAVDIGFKGNHAFILDKLSGVFVVNIEYAEDDAMTTKQRFAFQPKFNIKRPKGQFIQVVQDSLNIVASSAKNPSILEYIIQGGSELTEIVFNREIKMFQAVRDTYSDENFMYVLTGFFNQVLKHSIPKERTTDNVSEDYLTEYWPLFGIKAMVSIVNDKDSAVVAIQDNYITLYRFYQDVPVLSCSMEGVSEGLYTFEIEATQTECYNKEQNAANTDYKSVCIIRQDVELLVTSQETVLGDTQKNNKQIMYLLIGLGVLNFFVLVFICLCKKYKNEYNHLYQKVRLNKLDEENTGEVAGGSAKNSRTAQKAPSSQNELEPQHINIALELEKLEEQEKAKAQEMEKREKEKPTTDFGDMKPLDVDEIYGKGSGKKEDSF